MQGREVIIRHTFRSLFGKRVVKDFFFEEANDASIYIKVDVQTRLSNLKLDLHFFVLDAEGSRMEKINIPMQTVANADDQEIEVIIKSEYMKHMQGAYHLRLYMVFSADAISFFDEDLIVFKEAVLKPGGFHLEL